MSRIFKHREMVVFLLLCALVILIGVINPNFTRLSSLINVVNSGLVLTLIAIGVMFVLLTRGIDVSVGAIAGLSAVVLGTSLNAGIPIPIAIVFALLTGIACGMLNGFGITKLGVPPIIMTLGTLGIFRGAMLLITGGSWIETIPQEFKALARSSVFGIPTLIWATIIVAIVVSVILRRVKQARYFYAVGDNSEGAYLLGIPVNRTVFLAYTMAGLFAGAAGVVFVAQIGFVPTQTGNGMELKAIAAVVLGGVSLSGGVGGPISAIVGAVFLTAVDSMLIFLKVPGFWSNAVGGAILLTVVVIDYGIRRSVAKKQLRLRAQQTSQKSHDVAPSAADMDSAAEGTQ